MGKKIRRKIKKGEKKYSRVRFLSQKRHQNVFNYDFKILR